MENHPVLPQEFVGNCCCPDWIQPSEIYPRAQIGQPAPYFKATAYHDLEFKDVQLTDYAGKYVVLFFYPLDFTFVCPTEIISFADMHPQFAENNCQILAASTDSHFSHFEYCQKSRNKGGLGDLGIPVLSDFTKTIARIYGALITRGADAGVACR